MIDKNLFRFLQFRDEVLDLTSLEEEYGIQLPPVYRSFISVFKPYFAHHKIKKGDGEDYQSFIVPFYSSIELTEYTSDDDELALESFKEVDELFSFEPSNKGYLTDLLFIANHGYAGGLLLGIGEGNQDQIFHSADSTNVNFMANNIFELIHKIGLVQYDFDTPPVQTDRLYTNWGEDFWRIKE